MNIRKILENIKGKRSFKNKKEKIPTTFNIFLRKIKFSKKEKLYRCDPDKNKECKKSNCYIYYPLCCRHTNNKKYKMTNIFKHIREDLFLWSYLKRSKKLTKQHLINEDNIHIRKKEKRNAKINKNMGRTF